MNTLAETSEENNRPVKGVLKLIAKPAADPANEIAFLISISLIISCWFIIEARAIPISAAGPAKPIIKHYSLIEDISEESLPTENPLPILTMNPTVRTINRSRTFVDEPSIWSMAGIAALSSK